MVRFYPALFVFLWSTGFIGAKYGLPYAEPLSFLLIRYALVVMLMTGAAWVTRARWPVDLRAYIHLSIAGCLIHGVYLGGVFISISQGLPAGIVSLIVGLQPLLTAMLATLLLGEAVCGRQWVGLVLGIVGTGLVLSGRIDGQFSFTQLVPVLPAIGALLGITLGALYQKRFCPHFDWRTGAVVQFLAAAALTLPIAYAFEGFRVEFTGEFVFALGWLVLVLSLGAISLLNYLIRSGSSVNVASLFYLVPPVTALIAWGLFGETLPILGLVGLLVAVTGVALVRKR
ncbi:MAG: DMT family transporter [Fluviibacter sp.]